MIDDLNQIDLLCNMIKNGYITKAVCCRHSFFCDWHYCRIFSRIITTKVTTNTLLDFAVLAIAFNLKEVIVPTRFPLYKINHVVLNLIQQIYKYLYAGRYMFQDDRNIVVSKKTLNSVPKPRYIVNAVNVRKLNALTIGLHLLGEDFKDK